MKKVFKITRNVERMSEGSAFHSFFLSESILGIKLGFNTFKKIRSSAKGQQLIIFITTIIGTVGLCACLRRKAANAIGKDLLRIAK